MRSIFKDKVLNLIYKVKSKFINLNKTTKTNIIKKNKYDKIKIVILLFFIFISCVLFTYTTLKPSENDNLNVGIQITKAANKDVTRSKLNHYNNNLNLTSIENPFVSIDNYQNINDMSKSAQERLANLNLAKNNLKNESLPIIPNFNGTYKNEETSSIQLPTQLPTIPQFSATNNERKVIQGIMADENGNKIAIVNGQVVKKGDTLDGAAISEINNNGITFNNGNKISYNFAN